MRSPPSKLNNPLSLTILSLLAGTPPPHSMFLTFSIAFIILPQTNAQCGENIFTDKDFLTCSPDHQLDSSMSEFPTFCKAISSLS